MSINFSVLPDIEEDKGGSADYHSQIEGHWIYGNDKWPIANPIIDVIGSVIVEIELTNGINGVGISIGGEPACYIIEHHFSRFLKGEDQHNIEYLWDLMWCSLINYGRKGLTIQAISAVDIAL
ncbi:unnamed protein product [Rotaria sp. Silwood2]|nr:unnamed protein product [Rotaria sp. Silwood2]